MAMYKVRITVYKGPTGKTLKGPTFVHFLGDICLGFGVIGVLLAILAVTDMEKYGANGAKVIIVGIVMAVVGFVLMAVLHKQARKKAEAAFLSALDQQEKQMSSKKSN